MIKSATVLRKNGNRGWKRNHQGTYQRVEPTPSNKPWGSPFTTLTVYYATAALVVLGIVQLFPEFLEVFSGDRLRQLASRGLMGSPVVGVDQAGGDPFESVLMTFLAIVGCLVLLAPVAQVYAVVRGGEVYDASVVHTLMILPIPVTALVIVVQDSVALAFSLAGIVAAVRFRNTLQDTKDAVYIFLAIGTALAAGVEALGIAAVTTMLFNYLVLVMWRFRFGEQPIQPIK